jgi:hypothetical protein
MPNAMHKALAKREAICQSSAQSARALMHLLGSYSSEDFHYNGFTLRREAEDY